MIRSVSVVFKDVSGRFSYIPRVSRSLRGVSSGSRGFPGVLEGFRVFEEVSRVFQKESFRGLAFQTRIGGMHAAKLRLVEYFLRNYIHLHVVGQDWDSGHTLAELCRNR